MDEEEAQKHREYDRGYRDYFKKKSNPYVDKNRKRLWKMGWEYAKMIEVGLSLL